MLLFDVGVKMEKIKPLNMSQDRRNCVKLSKCLLKKDFGLDIEFPQGSLAPSLTLKLNYLLWIQDLLAESAPARYTTISSKKCLRCQSNNSNHILPVVPNVKSSAWTSAVAAPSSFPPLPSRSVTGGWSESSPMPRTSTWLVPTSRGIS